MKRNKAILCAVASFGLITAANTINANAMTMNNTVSFVQAKLTVSQVKDLINKLPYTVTLGNKAEFKTAIDAYNALDSIQKSELELYILDAQDIIKSAEERVQKFEAEETKAKELAQRIEKLKSKVDYSKDDKGLVSVNNDKLLANEDDIINIRNDYEGLNYYIQKDFKKSSLYKDFDTIEFKLAQAIWEQQ